MALAILEKGPVENKGDFTPTLTLVDGRPATTSLEVAKYFGKRHGNVIRDIRQTIANCPEKFTQLNFELSEYTDETGRTMPMFFVFRDGFMLLVMKYTGQKAMQIKVAYIHRFNEMEAELQKASRPSLPSLTPSTAVDRAALCALVKTWAMVSKMRFSHCWKQLNGHFNLERISDLPKEWIPEALSAAGSF